MIFPLILEKNEILILMRLLNNIMPYCTECGKEVEESWNACPSCGKVLKEVNIPQPQPVAQPQPQPQPQPYQTRPYPRSYSVGGQNNYGTAALVCGILGIFCGGILFGIVAIVLGGLGIGRDDNNGMAVIGLILGLIDIVCFFIMMFWILTWFTWFPNWW